MNDTPKCALTYEQTAHTCSKTAHTKQLAITIMPRVFSSKFKPCFPRKSYLIGLRANIATV